MRLWNSDLTPFLDDEAGLLHPAKLLIENHQLPATGGIPMSIHINEPPLIVYLVALPMLISRSPAWVTACFTFLDGVGTLSVYVAAKRLGGRASASAAALIYAVSPAAIYFTRKTDYFALTACLTGLAMAAAIYAWQQRSSMALAIAVAAAAISTEVHSSSAMTLLVCLALAPRLVLKLKPKWPLAAAAILIGLTLAPYVYLQTHTGWADLAGVIQFLRQPSHLDDTAARIAATLVGGGTYDQLLLPRDRIPPALLVSPAGWLVIGLVLAGLAVAIRKGSRGLWIPVVLAIAPVAFTLRHSTDIQPYYLMPILPPSAVLAGQALAAIRLRLPMAIVCAVSVVLQILGYLHFQSTIANDGPRLNYGTPLRYEMQAAALVSLPTGSRLFVAQPGNQRASFPYLTDYRYDISQSDSRYGFPIPTVAPSGPTYLVEAGDAPYDFLASHFGQPVASVRTPAGQPAFGLFHLPPDAAATIEGSGELTPVRAKVGTAVEIRGYAIPALAAGQPSPAVVEWAILDSRASLPAEVQQYLHLIDADGRTWSTDADERPYPRREWRTGEMVLSWFDLRPKASAPTGGYWLVTGFYGYTGGGALLVQSGAGSPGPGLRMGPVRLQGASEVQPQRQLRAVFGNGELGLLAVQRQGLDVTLEWDALKPSGADYTVFVHLLDSSGRIVAQHDGPPQDGSYPTSLWRPGDVVKDVHHLSGRSAGTTLEIGLYRRPSLRRLPVEKSDGTPLGDHLDVTS